MRYLLVLLIFSGCTPLRATPALKSYCWYAALSAQMHTKTIQQMYHGSLGDEDILSVDSSVVIVIPLGLIERALKEANELNRATGLIANIVDEFPFTEEEKEIEISQK